jgi:hypothetical protein
MLKPAAFVFLFLTVVCKIYGQDSLLVKISNYKKERADILANQNIYKYADLLTKNHRIGAIDTDTYRIADSLDKLHPRFYFNKANELIKQSKLNDASFIYYLGCLRYKYYNAINPYVKAADDGTLFSALQSVVGQPINMYLTANFENFTQVLKKSGDWFLNHDYTYFSKSNDTMGFLLVFDGNTKSIADLEKNKKKYTNEWKIQRLVIEQNFDKEIKEIDSELNKAARE